MTCVLARVIARATVGHRCILFWRLSSKVAIRSGCRVMSWPPLGQFAVALEGSAYLRIAVDLVRSSKLTLCAKSGSRPRNL
jgi:hypothetical protein